MLQPEPLQMSFKVTVLPRDAGPNESDLLTFAHRCGAVNPV
jgi:hypothetical protein